MPDHERTDSALPDTVVCFSLPAAMLGVCSGPEPVGRAIAGTARALDEIGPATLFDPTTIRPTPQELLGAPLFERIDEVRTTGEVLRGREWPVELAGPDDTTLSLYLDLVLRPMYTEHGAIQGVHIQAVDVTDAVRARQNGTRRADRPAHPASDTPVLLQQALLPASVPVLPTLDLGAGYLFADDEGTAGGDWFDAIPLPDGSVALAVGDVVGHGVTAAATMGQLRAVLRERLRAGLGPAEAVTDLDRFATDLAGARAATVCVAVLDPGSGTLEYCTAGHPPPLVIAAGGADSHYLASSGGGPLATGSPHRAALDELADEEMLLLYTDGIVERPGLGLERGRADLAQVAAEATAGLSRVAEDDVRRGQQANVLCTRLVTTLTAVSGHADDITVLAARRHPPLPALELEFAARLDAPVGARRAMLGWLAELRLDAETTFALLHAVNEVVTNAVEHAYADTVPGSIELHATVSDRGEVHVVVADRGRWPTAGRNRHRGFGLIMAAALADELTIDRSPTGTTVLITQQARRLVPVRTSMTDPAPGASTAAEPFLAATLSEESDAPLMVRGTVDADTVAALRDELRSATHAGTISRTVDLTGVTLLGSVGVHALYEARERCTAQHEELRLVASPGSAAWHVLELVALPHR
ncbi:MAG TPA: SpoIIE family protein phosphatase [Pseudonocardiaceae bacterium]|nr:SpoIIE family protein phosphatase [Pseudonocardiaceae bacterium]